MKLRALITAFLILAALSAPAGVFGQPQKPGLLIGLIPEENIFRQMEKYKPLEAYLSGKLGIKVKFTILSKYGDIIDRFTSRGLDGAFFGVFTAVLAHEKLGIDPLARLVNKDGSTTVEGYVIVRKDSGIDSIGGLRGKRAAFVDRATATGFVFPVALLKSHGYANIDSFFAEYYFTGSQDSVAFAVLDGRADVGAMKSRIFNRLTEREPLIKDELHVLAKSAPLPDTTLCLRHGLEPGLKKSIEEALFHMHDDPKGKEVLKKLEAVRFVDARMADFAPVIDLLKRADINLRAYKYGR